MISVIIPVLNECDSIAELHGEIVQVIARQNLEAEIIFVDDGSTDDTWQMLTNWKKQGVAIRALRLRRRFGKATALAVGFRIARGDIVVTIDGDLQDDPAEIPGLITQLQQGFDLVSGWKRERRDSWHRVMASRVFNFVVSWSTGVHLHDHVCGLKCYRAEVVRDLQLSGEMHRFIPVLVAAKGYRISERSVNHRPRKYGRSKYGVSRLFSGILGLITVKYFSGRIARAVDTNIVTGEI